VAELRFGMAEDIRTTGNVRMDMSSDDMLKIIAFRPWHQADKYKQWKLDITLHPDDEYIIDPPC